MTPIQSMMGDSGSSGANMMIINNSIGIEHIS
jgi:hypothetical protein